MSVITKLETWSWTDDVLPFVAMLMLIFFDTGVLTIVKAAMNDGLGSISYVVYHNALGTLILLPFLLVHMFRNAGRPRLTFYILFRLFILGLLGLCIFQIVMYVGVNYSSPTLSSAITNLIPGNTFLLAATFRMEKIDIRSSSSLSKLFGTLIAICGAMVVTFYQGPQILQTIASPDTTNQLLLSQPSNWVFGGVILVIGGIIRSIYFVLQTATTREYHDQQTIVFFYGLFGTIQCIVISPFLEPNPKAWVVKPGISLIAVVLGAVYSTVFHSNIVIWCLRKKGPVFVSMFSPFSIVTALILGVTFLGDSLHLGSIIGATIITTGFYAFMWGQAKEKRNSPVMIVEDSTIVNESGLSDENVPMLRPSIN
ncbi:WAT1-related protein At5g40240-like [Rutidosis leptorrhynchoides]|uniref:WAT1-related protein At5g40240-like n=1 Tax=Rutidosis leptorrhynchoides TaxID=125765 RepID=UPI003A99CCCD